MRWNKSSLVSALLGLSAGLAAACAELPVEEPSDEPSPALEEQEQEQAISLPGRPVNPCTYTLCPAGTQCVPVGTPPRAQCRPIDRCALIRCRAGTHCEDGQCIPDEKVFCGGIAGFPCKGAGKCVDDPTDSCDPKQGGADCGGMCICPAVGLCTVGSHWDSSPSVCACVPNAGGIKCGDNTCGAGQFCCNASCGICAPKGGACIQLYCDPKY